MGAMIADFPFRRDRLDYCNDVRVLPRCILVCATLSLDFFLV